MNYDFSELHQRSPGTLQTMAVEGVAAAMILAGDDPTRDGVQDTPARWVKALVEQCEGFKLNPNEQLDTTFDVQMDEMVVVTGLPFTSLCEHHLLPFTGEAAIGYLPGRRIVGLSKLPRLLHAWARRPQVQEQLTVDIANTLCQQLAPIGVGVRLTAHHTCMSCRGIRSNGTMVTQALKGSFRDNPTQRAEFLDLVNH